MDAGSSETNRLRPRNLSWCCSPATKATCTSRGPTVDVLVVSGVPLREPVARYGPFVMNTRDELVQAVDDYQSGAMGRIAATS